LLGQEQKQHGKDFYVCDATAQGRPASKSGKTRKDCVPMKTYSRFKFEINNMVQF